MEQEACLDPYQNAEKINSKVTVIYQERSETASLRIYLEDGWIIMDIDTLDQIQLTRGLQCWLDKSTGNFRLQHNDEFSDLPSMVVFQFNAGFEPEKVRFEQLMLKYATFHEYHSRPSFNDECLPSGPPDEDEHIYEDLDQIRLNMNLGGFEHTIEKNYKNMMKKVTPLIERLKGGDRKNRPEPSGRQSPQSLSRSSSCSSQPTPPGGIYDGPIQTVNVPIDHTAPYTQMNVSPIRVVHDSSVNPGYVTPTMDFTIYPTGGQSPETFRRESMDSDKSVDSSKTRTKSRRPTRKPPAPPPNTKAFDRKSIRVVHDITKESIYNDANFINKSNSAPTDQPVLSQQTQQQCTNQLANPIYGQSPPPPPSNLSNGKSPPPPPPSISKSNLNYPIVEIKRKLTPPSPKTNYTSCPVRKSDPGTGAAPWGGRPLSPSINTSLPTPSKSDENELTKMLKNRRNRVDSDAANASSPSRNLPQKSFTPPPAPIEQKKFAYGHGFLKSTTPIDKPAFPVSNLSKRMSPAKIPPIPPASKFNKPILPGSSIDKPIQTPVRTSSGGLGRRPNGTSEQAQTVPVSERLKVFGTTKVATKPREPTNVEPTKEPTKTSDPLTLKQRMALLNKVGLTHTN